MPSLGGDITVGSDSIATEGPDAVALAPSSARAVAAHASTVILLEEDARASDLSAMRSLLPQLRTDDAKAAIMRFIAARSAQLQVDFALVKKSAAGAVLFSSVMSSTIEYDSFGLSDTKPVRQCLFDELLEFVTKEVLPVLGMRERATGFRLFARSDPARTPVLLADSTRWNSMLAQWGSTETATIFVVDDNETNRLDWIRTIDLSALQNGTSARRTGDLAAKVPKQVREKLAVSEFVMATDVMHEVLTGAEVLLWLDFHQEVCTIFGTPLVHPNPGMWYCWYGASIEARNCFEFMRINQHLRRCNWAGAATMRRRLFERKMHNTISAPLPESMPAIRVPQRMKVDAQIELANGMSDLQTLIYTNESYLGSAQTIRNAPTVGLAR